MLNYRVDGSSVFFKTVGFCANKIQISLLL